MRRVALLLAFASAAFPVCGPSTPAAAQERDPATVDVCALLSTADAESAADAVRQADERGTGTTYAIDRIKEDLGGVLPSSYCKFVLTETDGAGYSGVIGIKVESASGFSFYKHQGPAVDGFGDEAVRITGSLIVRAGDFMLSVGQNSFDQQLTEEILRKVAARIMQAPAPRN